ncbi:hypothetical protein [Enterovirga aerilata]|uniref:Uncharacterized protein n=1 Tax=Enterovirga aerilata TaxID=2730920 RepID=A0A849ICE0_9HYPH|nr:hypothetical protein [Enterovirga sp. DB1703]NNM74089.1 hypothetical protein [Enterovirga sp. DB1703]
MSSAGARLARSRLIAHFEMEARELDRRADRLRRSLPGLSDAGRHAEVLAAIAQLAALAQINRCKAERLRALGQAGDGPSDPDPAADPD